VLRPLKRFRQLSLSVKKSLREKHLKSPQHEKSLQRSKFAAAENNWGIQVGAFVKKQEADAQISTIGGLHVLAKSRPNVSPLTRNGQTLYRARFDGLSVKDAQAACKALACLIVAS